MNDASQAVIAQKGPYEVELAAGETYWWCACGRSAKQPFCDGSHKKIALKPVEFKSEKSETAYFCGCKRTGKRPFYDGTHGKL